MPLTDTAIRNARPADKPYSRADEKGLALLIQPNGAKWWRFRYRFDGKAKMLSLGVYPDVPLASARAKRDEARMLLAGGSDPGVNRKAVKAAKVERAANSFEVVAREWYAKYAPSWVASHGGRIIRRLEVDIFPWLGGRPIAEINAPELLACVRRIEERGAKETAHRALANCGQVFAYAIATGRVVRNPVPDLRGALPPVKQKHHAAILDPASLGKLLRAIETYQGGLVARCALRLAPLVFVRPGELRHAEWDEFDLDAAMWTIPAAKMKIKDQGDHMVPLSSQAVAILRELQALSGRGRYVFPSNRGQGRPMSENTVNAALRYLGFDKDTMTGHGFRAIARTHLDETLGFPPDVIEHQLAHGVRDPLGRAYNRTTHIAARCNMMQGWADHLDKLRKGAEVVPIGRAA